MTIDATPMSPTANSYATVAEGDVYFANRMNFATWDDSLEQEQALIQATLLLDTYDYLGDAVTTTQALKWPRLLDGVMIRNFGGTLQVETATIVGTITGNGNASVTVTAAGMTGSTIALSVAVLNGDTPTVSAGKIRTALNANVNIAAFFTVGGTGAAITLTTKVAAANDTTMNLAYTNGTCTGLTPNATSTDTTLGALWAVPTPIKNAQFEIALWLIQTGGAGVAVAAGAVESMKIGNEIEAKFSSGSSGAAVVDTTVDPTGLPIQAARFLKGLRLYSVLA